MKDFLKKIFWSRSTVIRVPYIWLFLFFAVPFIWVFKISLALPADDIPPYTHLYTYNPEDTLLSITLYFKNFLAMFPINSSYDHLYLIAYGNSLRLAFFSTIFCLLLGYPTAYAISRTSPATQNMLMLGIILPSWTSYLVRTYAIVGLIKDQGIINHFLIETGFLDFLVRIGLLHNALPLQMEQTDFAMYYGIVYIYAPFMIFPIYSNLVKLDDRHLEASADLGATPWKTFLNITLPLTKGGVIAGCMLVFIPAVGEYALPNLLGGPEQLMIGRVLGDEFDANHDWPRASAVAVSMLAFLLIPIVYFHKIQAKQIEEGKA